MVAAIRAAGCAQENRGTQAIGELEQVTEIGIVVLGNLQWVVTLFRASAHLRITTCVAVIGSLSAMLSCLVLLLQMHRSMMHRLRAQASSCSRSLLLSCPCSPWASSMGPSMFSSAPVAHTCTCA